MNLLRDAAHLHKYRQSVEIQCVWVCVCVCVCVCKMVPCNQTLTVILHSDGSTNFKRQMEPFRSHIPFPLEK